MTNDYPDTVALASVTLDVFQLSMRRALSRRQLDAIALHLDFWVEQQAEQIIMNLKARVLSKQLDYKTIRYPDGALEALKAAFYRWLNPHMQPHSGHFPWIGEYLARRWPVRHVVVEIDVRALYPSIPIPDRCSRVIVVDTSRIE